MTDDEMASELRSKGWRVQEPLTQANCTHPNKIGTGSCGSDGSSHTEWWCAACGAHERHETPPRANHLGIVLTQQLHN
jgi:hypothetical protein